MGRLIVEAVDAELPRGHHESDVHLAVSVSLADDGSAVTGLEVVNFRITELQSLSPVDYRVTHAVEGLWDPLDKDLSGCYLLPITFGPSSSDRKMRKGDKYTFGLGVRVFSGPFQINEPPPRLRHQGQTVVSVINKGLEP
jgi:hypothetical protein